MIEIQPATEAEIPQVRLLLRAYAAGTGVDLCFQDFEREVAELPRMVLDTLPVMDGAQRLYARLGFREIPPYRPSPVPGARFLELDLG